jgi:hypothetical protein
MKVIIDAAVHSEHEQLIICDIKPGSNERSMNQ